MVTSADTNIISWNQGNLQFVLSSPHAGLTERAGEIFRYWRFPNDISQDTDNNTINYQVNPTEAGFDLQVDRPRHSGRDNLASCEEPIACKDICSTIRAIETETVLAIFDHPNLFNTIHGALLAREGDAMLLVGPAQSGKSTLACALWADGWQLLADDTTIFNPADCTAIPVLRRVSLRHPSRSLLGEDFWNKLIKANSCDPSLEGYLFHPDEFEPQSRSRTVKLRGILFLQRRNAKNASPDLLTSLPPDQTLLSLAPYTNVVRHLGMGEAMQRLSLLINNVPAFDLGRAPLPVMIKTVDDLLQSSLP